MCPDLLVLLLGVEGGREDDVCLSHSQQDTAALHGCGGGGGAWHISKKMLTKLYRSTACIQRKGGREGGQPHTHTHTSTAALCDVYLIVLE